MSDEEEATGLPCRQNRGGLDDWRAAAGSRRDAGARMRRPYFVGLFLVALLCGSFLAIPVDDPDTAFDESETTPWENSPPFARGILRVFADKHLSTLPRVLPSSFGSRARCWKHRLAQLAGLTDPGMDSLIIVVRSLRC